MRVVTSLCSRRDCIWSALIRLAADRFRSGRSANRVLVPPPHPSGLCLPVTFRVATCGSSVLLHCQSSALTEAALLNSPILPVPVPVPPVAPSDTSSALGSSRWMRVRVPPPPSEAYLKLSQSTKRVLLNQFFLLSNISVLGWLGCGCEDAALLICELNHRGGTERLAGRHSGDRMI